MEARQTCWTQLELVETGKMHPEINTIHKLAFQWGILIFYTHNQPANNRRKESIKLVKTTQIKPEIHTMQAPIFFYKVNPVRIFQMHQELQYLQK